MAPKRRERGESSNAPQQRKRQVHPLPPHLIHMALNSEMTTNVRGFWMLKHMMKVVLAEKGAIMIGGLITTLALHLELDPTGLEKATGLKFIDKDTLMAMHMIVREGNGFALRVPSSGFTIRLPYPLLTSCQSPANWKYELTANIYPLDNANEELVDDAFLDEEDEPPAKGQSEQPAQHLRPCQPYDFSALQTFITNLEERHQRQEAMMTDMHAMITSMYQ